MRFHDGQTWNPIAIETPRRRSAKKRFAFHSSGAELSCRSKCPGSKHDAFLLGFELLRIHSRHLFEVFDGLEFTVFGAIINNGGGLRAP
jgi:hypothetical protein